MACTVELIFLTSLAMKDNHPRTMLSVLHICPGHFMRKCNSLIYAYQGNDKLNKDVSVIYQAPLKPHPHGVLYTKIILEVITICSL